MSDLIYNNMTFQANNEPAWHKKGTTFPDTVSLEMAFKALKSPQVLELALQAIIDANNTIDVTTGKTLFLVTDDNQVKELSTVPKTYTVVQPETALNAFKPLIDAKLVELETGGWLKNGIFWLQAKLANAVAEVVPNDIIQKRMLLFTDYNRVYSATFKGHTNRVVCWNTIQPAIAEDSNFNFKFKHTASVNDNIENSIKLVKASLEAFTQNIEVYKQLTKVKLTAQNMKDYYWNVFAPEAVTKEEKDARPKIKSKVERVIDLAEIRREYSPAVLGTAWHAYNAVSHYLSHDSTKNDDKRLQSLWFGKGNELNQRAMNLATAMIN